MRPLILASILCLVAASPYGPAQARDFAVYPIGRPHSEQGLRIAAEYFQPIDLEGGMMQAADGADIHLEADVAAGPDDPDGYAEGDWRPYLTVTYRLTKLDSGETLNGTLMPLVSYGSASIGKPHYGDNLKLFGPGRYRLALTVAPPPGAATPSAFTVEDSFVFAGIGKKGAY